jgi:hypothetical protein
MDMASQKAIMFDKHCQRDLGECDFERKEMNRSKARKWIRKAIIAINRFCDAADRVEREILGGFADWPTEQMAEKVREAARPERLAAFIAAHKNDPPSLDRILKGAALGVKQEEIDDDSWIDGIIDEIRESFRGVPILNDEDEIVIFDP